MNNNNVVERLINGEWDKLIYNISHRFYNRHFYKIHCISREDLYQEGFAKALSLANHYNSERSKFSTILSIALQNLFTSLIRKYRNEIDSKEITDSTFTYNNTDVIDDHMDAKQILSELSNDNKTLLEDYYLHGKSLKTIGEQHGVSDVTIFNRLKRIKTKFNENLSRHKV